MQASMKNLQNNFFQNPLVFPVLVLFVSSIFGGLPPVAIKVALKELSSPMIMFLRLCMMVPIFFLLSRKNFPLLRTQWKAILPIALGWAGNMIMFSIGIPHTSAAVSQVIYTGVPVIVVALSPWLLKEVPTNYQVGGIGIGLIGTLVTVFSSGSIHAGNSLGNTLVLAAAFSWALYVIASRKLKTAVPAALNLFVGSCIAWIGFGFMVMGTSSGFMLPPLSLATIYALLFLGLIGGVFMFFAHQWGAQRVPAAISGSTGYISVMSGVLVSWLILGEQLERWEWFGLILLLVAVMLTTTIPLLIRRRASRMV